MVDQGTSGEKISDITNRYKFTTNTFETSSPIRTMLENCGIFERVVDIRKSFC